MRLGHVRIECHKRYVRVGVAIAAGSDPGSTQGSKHPPWITWRGPIVRICMMSGMPTKWFSLSLLLRRRLWSATA